MYTRKYKSPLVKPVLSPGKASKSPGRKPVRRAKLPPIKDDPNGELLEKLYNTLDKRSPREPPLSRKDLKKYKSNKRNSIRLPKKPYQPKNTARHSQHLRATLSDKNLNALTNQELHEKLAHNFNSMHNDMTSIRTTRYNQEKKNP